MIGFAVYCYYCDTTDHDAWKCKNKSKPPPCYYCANAPGNANHEFRKKAKWHRTYRCAYEYLHAIPEFSDQLKERLDFSELRALGRAAVGDKEVDQWENNGLLPAEPGNEMIPGYETDTEWLNELDDKARKNALKKFKKVAKPTFSDFHLNASSSHSQGESLDQD
ncbi:hypothetical protein P171DRAFT_515570 [Karstenula rhodostoma CBS 690.94]|uniref:Uncharacterized protein n=1 Tax=Karstenula rhodostoma CBS 690.94 TaxID=1392251 RepID=A0A9P4PWM1_9PLEO|nr:hypothetical protein P171DRAFT_515570 [Karstenula rhodostoma CBS 690.94]